MMMPTRRAIAHVLGVAIGLAGLAFVAVRIHRDWAQVTDTLHTARPGWLVVALLSGVASMTLIGVNWLALIRDGGGMVPARRGLSWFFAGQLGKYVPGGIWPVVGQAELATRGGVDRRTSYLATVSSMAYMLLAAMSVAALTGLASPYGRRPVALLLGTAVVVLLLVLAVPRCRALARRVVSTVTRGRVELPTASVVATAVARHVPVWLSFGLVNVCVFVSVGGHLSGGGFVDLLFVSSLSWIVGFVVIGVPGGIGVRESVFVALMTAPLGAPLALSIAVASRFVTIAVDLTTALVAGSIARFSVRPTAISTPAAVER